MIKTIKIPAINVRSASHLTGVCQYASLSTRMTLIYVDMLCVFFYFYRTYDFEDMSQGLQMLQHFYIFCHPSILRVERASQETSVASLTMAAQRQEQSMLPRA